MCIDSFTVFTFLFCFPVNKRKARVWMFPGCEHLLQWNNWSRFLIRIAMKPKRDRSHDFWGAPKNCHMAQTVSRMMANRFLKTDNKNKYAFQNRYPLPERSAKFTTSDFSRDHDKRRSFFPHKHDFSRRHCNAIKTTVVRFSIFCDSFLVESINSLPKGSTKRPQRNFLLVTLWARTENY